MLLMTQHVIYIRNFISNLNRYITILNNTSFIRDIMLEPLEKNRPVFWILDTFSRSLNKCFSHSNIYLSILSHKVRPSTYLCNSARSLSLKLFVAGYFPNNLAHFYFLRRVSVAFFFSSGIQVITDVVQ